MSYLIRALDTNGTVTLTPELLNGEHNTFLVAMMTCPVRILFVILIRCSIC
jgi:hypothetical protein